MKSEKITVTLTDQPPVLISNEIWPVIATARGDSWTGGDYARHEQALAQRELDRYFLRVRQHADGRALVYGVLTAAPAWTGSEDNAGGYLLDPGDDIVASIRQVGEEVGIPERLVRECIADLPATELT